MNFNSVLILFNISELQAAFVIFPFSDQTQNGNNNYEMINLINYETDTNLGSSISALPLLEYLELIPITIHFI